MRLLSKRLRLGSAFLVAALACAFWAPSANAQRNCPAGSDSPPGNSEIDQYSENVPGPCGDQPVNPPGGDSDTPGADPLPSGTADDLSSFGADGQAAAALAQSTAPPNRGLDGANGGEGAGAAEGASPGTAEDGDSILESIVNAFTGSADGEDGDGLGLLLPLILAAVLLAAIAYGIRRRLVE
jgi:hypothetical protein